MIYAIRHGETDWNKEGRIQGSSSDQPLNSCGILQARQASEKLIGLGISVIYSSDLLRAKQTAQEINKILNVDLIETPLLRETCYGEVEGRLVSDIDKNPFYKRICQAVDAGDYHACFPGGESRSVVVERLMTFLKQIDKKGNSLLLTHGGLLRSFTALYAGIDQKIPNCGGVKFMLDDKNLPQHIELF